MKTKIFFILAFVFILNFVSAADNFNISSSAGNHLLFVNGTSGDVNILKNLNVTGTIYGSVSGDDEYWNVSGDYLFPYDLSKNVGIGTTSPAEKLHIRGTGENILMGVQSGGNSYWGISAINSTNRMDIGPWASSHTLTPYMTLLAGGNVGIGTTTPDSKLEVTGDVHIDGDLFFETDGTGLPYGEMYANNVTHTVDIVSADTYVEVDGDLTGGELNLCTFPDDHYVQVTKAGRYLVNWSMSISCASANQEIEGAVMVGGTASTKGTAHGNMITANSPITISGTLILDLAANAQLSLGLANHTGTTDVVLNHASMTATMVGGT